MYDILPGIIQSNPSQFRMSMYETSREIEGAYGEERVKVLKKAFNRIIECCLPLSSKVLLSASSYLQRGKLLSLMRKRSKGDLNIYKFSKVTSFTGQKEEKDYNGENNHTRSEDLELNGEDPASDLPDDGSLMSNERRQDSLDKNKDCRHQTQK